VRDAKTTVGLYALCVHLYAAVDIPPDIKVPVVLFDAKLLAAITVPKHTVAAATLDFKIVHDAL